MHGAGGADDLLLGIQQGVGKRKGRLPDLFRFDPDLEDIADKQGQFIVGFGMDYREEKVFVSDELREPETDGLQESLVGIMDNLKLVAEEQEPRGVGFVQFDFRLIDIHGYRLKIMCSTVGGHYNTKSAIGKTESFPMQDEPEVRVIEKMVP